ncbi:unnamed protein product, partial [Closterium sp. NIES-54]
MKGSRIWCRRWITITFFSVSSHSISSAAAPPAPPAPPPPPPPPPPLVSFWKGEANQSLKTLLESNTSGRRRLRRDQSSRRSF